MILYNIQTNGSSNLLIIEVVNDTVSVEPSAVAYVTGDLALNAAGGGFGKRIKAAFIGKRYFKPTFTGTGKIYLNAIFGSYHQFTLQDNQELILAPGVFVACCDTISVVPDISESVVNFISGLPIVKTLIKGAGNVMIAMPGPMFEHDLNGDKFVAYGSDVIAYSSKITLTREFAGKGWLSIAKQMVQIYRGTGKMYFCPNPNKGSKRK